MNKKICEFCGTKISKNDIFCKGCGAKIDKNEEIKDAVIEVDKTSKKETGFLLYIILFLLIIIIITGLFLILF